MKTARLLRAKAPLRVSFCGGGTDVAPYPERFGGCVLSCTIDRFAYVTIRERADDSITVKSLDFGLDVSYAGGLAGAGEKLSLVDALFTRFGARGLDLFMHSDAPPGSGLGSSSAMIVALSAALARRAGMDLSPHDLAELACKIERDDLGIVGGLQDQYAASFGGFNFIEFSADDVMLTPLRIGLSLQNELHYHLLLCDTGATRMSSHIVERQQEGVRSDDAAVLSSLHRMKEMTVDLKTHLLRGDIPQFGKTLDAAWNCKRALASGITNPEIDRLYEAAMLAGAWGGKILGAGGGGFLLVCTPFSRRQRVAEALEGAGGVVRPFQFEPDGVRTWSALGETWIE